MDIETISSWIGWLVCVGLLIFLPEHDAVNTQQLLSISLAKPEQRWQWRRKASLLQCNVLTPLKDGVHGCVGPLFRLPVGGLRGDKGDVEQVGEDHHGAVEGEQLLPLGGLGGAKGAHDGGDDDPGQGLRQNGGEAEEVALRYTYSYFPFMICSYILGRLERCP